MILLFGPTGVGKTRLLDRLFTGRAEVISADSLQVYRDLDIGTAKPPAQLRRRLPHHLIDIIDYTESFSAGEFRRLADEAIAGIRSRGRIPIISGGTAFYLKAWLMGLPETPVVDPGLRRELERRWSDRSMDELRGELARVDPVSAGRIGKQDRYRMLRALEVFEQTGQPLSSIPLPGTPRTDCRCLLIGLTRNRSDLYARIDERVERMFEEGLADEVASLRASGATREHPGMKGIGYREWFDVEQSFPDGTGGQSIRRAVRDLIARNTRRYAKRQITFFSSLPGVRWYDAASPDLEDELMRLVDHYTTDGTRAP